MTQQSTVHVYRTMTDAEDAIKRLIDRGFPANQISIVTKDLQTEKKVHGFITAGDLAASGATSGAWVGGLFGLLMGAAFIFVPGFGPLVVAGPFAAALLGGVEGVAVGAVGGGLLGALFGWGVSNERILKYEEVVKAGNYLVIVNGDDAQIQLARSILGEHSTVEHVFPEETERIS